VAVGIPCFLLCGAYARIFSTKGIPKIKNKINQEEIFIWYKFRSEWAVKDQVHVTGVIIEEQGYCLFRARFTDR